jgi:hypothetical protein
MDLRGQKWWKAREDCINKELHNLYISPNTVSMIKLRRMRRVGHIECIRDKCIQNFARKTSWEEITQKT